MRVKVVLICEECLSRNYTTTKNDSKNNERIELKKYCKNCNKYTIHKESR
jgi:large subunit ribosomal protein L33